jgi:hypothetical protein
MYAANGARMTIGGLGSAGPFSDVLFLPDLRVNLLSQKQAMRDGSRITLSPDAKIFTVVLPPNRILKFIFDGTFWIWDDDSQFLRPAQMEQSLAVISAAEPTDHADNWSMAATISYSGAVQEFLMLHFRLGHLNYTAMLRAPQAGTWTQSPEYPPGAAAAMPCVPPDEEQASAYLERRPLRPASPRPAVPHGPQDGDDAFNQPRALHRRHHR